MKLAEPSQVALRGAKIYRIIPSQFPPINIFERIVDASQLEAAWYLEGLTNDRLRDAAGDITLVNPEDRVTGRGSSVVMAAFTHIGNASRFTDGTFGVYYAARSLETAVRETAFHRTNFLAATKEAPGEIDMRAYVGRVRKPLSDLRAPRFRSLHDPNDYSISQAYAKQRRARGDWGLLYNSVRHPGGLCVAAFRPPTVSIPMQGPALAYIWDGKRIDKVYEKSEVLFEFGS